MARNESEGSLFKLLMTLAVIRKNAINGRYYRLNRSKFEFTYSKVLEVRKGAFSDFSLYLFNINHFLKPGMLKCIHCRYSFLRVITQEFRN